MKKIFLLLTSFFLAILVINIALGFGVDDSGFGVTSMNLSEDLSPQLGADLDAQEYNLDNVGNVIHDDAIASDWTLQNIDLDKDILFSGNDGTVQTTIMSLDVSAGQLSGIVKAVTGVLTNAVADTDYLVNIVADITPQLGAILDAQEYGIDNVGDVIHDDATPSNWIFRNEDLDMDILFYGNDGTADTAIMSLDVSAGQLSGLTKAVAGVLTNATVDVDYLVNIVADTTPQLGAILDGQEYGIDNVGDITHDDATASDWTLINIDLDKDIIFSGNDGTVQKTIMSLDVSEGQLSGLLKATTGVLGAAVAGTDYYNPGGTDVAVADGGTSLSTVAAGSILAANTLDTITAVTYTSTSATLTNVAGTIAWSESILPAKVTADPCATYLEGTIFYNNTSHYPCYCDGTNDVKLVDNTTACF